MPKSVVAGISGAARIQRLNMSQLGDAEQHGLRLDKSSAARKVRDAEPLTTTGLDLATLRERHVAGVMVPKSDTIALHMFCQFPTDLVDGNDSAWMLEHARQFAAKVFGDRAVFADRIDRDEVGLHGVDLFLAPRYVKKTKHSEKEAVSISKHLKDLAVTTGRWDPAKGRDAPLVVQGQALQDAWFEYLRTEGQLAGVERGSPKRTRGSDWMPAEVLDIERRQEAVAAAETSAAMLQRKAEAFSLGVDGWAAGEVQPIRNEDGKETFRFRDAEARARLWPAIKPAFFQLWEWMTEASKKMADRVADLVRAAAADREEAAKDRALAAAAASPAALQRALDAHATPERVRMAIAAKMTPEVLQRAAEALLTPQLLQDVLTEKITAARAANSALNAGLFARQRRGQEM